jgi:predicted ATPase
LLGDDALRKSGDLVRSVQSWFEKAMDGNRVTLERVSLEGANDLPRILVHDPIRDVSVDLSETGAGFAQVLPVVVQSLGRSAGRIASSLVIVEQPELHLHPAAHGAIADLISEAAVASAASARFMCETHSEQFIMRIRRRIAEGRIPHDAVNIVSVGHQAEPGARVEPLRVLTIDEYGNPSAWPAGVFDEALDDLVELREAASQRDG